MFKIFRSFFLIILCLGSLSAQTFVGKLNPFPSSEPAKITSGDTLKILAVMVNFMQDRDGTTFGNGKFGSIYTKDYGTSILDPLPHDKTYFVSHLEFVKNYFEKVSGGIVNITFTVLPDTFSVSQTMRNYSPANNSDDFTPIANFSREVWKKADSLNPGFNFADYDVFTIFHAGVGRDISLPGSIGNEKDMPSVYLSLDALQNIFGSSFEGFPVSGGTYNIKNSMIIPETESRELDVIGGSVLFQISINGLLAASIGSYLGLPDLFDTETGLSAIGRFGLMDGQAIFAYNGIFPPEPSAWEKIYLGWSQPKVISPGNYAVNVVTGLTAVPADTSILKVPINSSEYYLVENRERDANNDGSKITYVINGSTNTRTFYKDTTGYYSFDVDSVDGVVTDVDEFDWAVPGNGIVIWHIDDNIINAKIAANKINTDKNNRGVDVEEADGVQDIGEQFTTILGDVVIGEGSSEDFWYKSNPSELYQNKFSKDTRPPAITNSGANSLITMSDFSEISNKMSFKVAYGDSVIKPIFSIGLPILGNEYHLTPLQKYFSFGLVADSSLYFIDNRGMTLFPLLQFSNKDIASFTNQEKLYIVGVNGNHINEFIANTSDSSLVSVNVDGVITSPPVIQNIENAAVPKLLVGTSGGKIFIYNPDSLSTAEPNNYDIDANVSIEQIAVNGNYVAAISSSVNRSVEYKGYWDNQGNSVNFKNETPVKLELTKNRTGDYVAVVLTSDNNFYIISGSKVIGKWTAAPSALISSFALADLKQDGENYIVYNEGKRIEARNLSGASADNFPFEDPDNKNFTSTILTADFEGDNRSEIIALTEDGRIFAVDGGSGKVVNGFPIAAGSSLLCVPVLYVDNNKISYAVLNKQLYFSAWNIGLTAGTIFWGGESGNPENSGFVEAASSQNRITTFLPENRAYNYPNPVYEGKTYIRYYVSEDAKINIKIFDLAGDYVAELNDEARGGLDNETLWNVGEIQSGVYFARIEATGISGKSDSKIIKIAVVK
ncbi:MAG TPA: T9SS type A sorting domain-containing protein [Ignavibacteriaceae bacterium]|nr:T9SS type A sorting domain-containing protein [Ignavibacteriaceae bacterium]